MASVRSILEAVRERGDVAVREFTRDFDGVARAELEVPAAEVRSALQSIDPQVRDALELAAERIAAHHRAQLRDEVVHDDDGVQIRSYLRPVDRVGCYVPGGRAAYPSTLLMTAVPAIVAGVVAQVMPEA